MCVIRAREVCRRVFFYDGNVVVSVGVSYGVPDAVALAQHPALDPQSSLFSGRVQHLEPARRGPAIKDSCNAVAKYGSRVQMMRRSSSIMLIIASAFPAYSRASASRP
jgi:hypothetical protein